MDRLFASGKPHPSRPVVTTQNDDSVRSLAANGLESWNKLCTLVAINVAHARLAVVPVKMNVENAFARCPCVIYRLHCPRHSFAADTRANGTIQVGDQELS